MHKHIRQFKDGRLFTLMPKDAGNVTGTILAFPNEEFTPVCNQVMFNASDFTRYLITDLYRHNKYANIAILQEIKE